MGCSSFLSGHLGPKIPKPQLMIHMLSPLLTKTHVSQVLLVTKRKLSGCRALLPHVIHQQVLLLCPQTMAQPLTICHAYYPSWDQSSLRLLQRPVGLPVFTQPLLKFFLVQQSEQFVSNASQTMSLLSFKPSHGFFFSLTAEAEGLGLSKLSVVCVHASSLTSFLSPLLSTCSSPLWPPAPQTHCAQPSPVPLHLLYSALTLIFQISAQGSLSSL